MVDLANDCFRFVTRYFEVISVSSPHIYHSALILAPKKSIVWKLYGSQAEPFAKVVLGGLISWDTHTTAIRSHSEIQLAVWSPCNRFIAVNYDQIDIVVDVLDSVTLQCLQTLNCPVRTTYQYKTLVFSPNSHIITYSADDMHSRETVVVSWDLQTGGVVSAAWQPRLGPEYLYKTTSMVYSADGKTAGIFYQYVNPNDTFVTTRISIFNVASGDCMHSHLLEDCTLLSKNTWTQGESLLFISTDVAAITIWEVVFTSSTPPTKVETFSVPNIYQGSDGQFSPTSSRLAHCLQEGLMVWDVCNSRYLLHCTDTKFFGELAFSPNGCFLACLAKRSMIYLWKDSPVGFILHGRLTPSTSYPTLLLSQDCKSIATYWGPTFELWNATEVLPTTPPSALTQASQHASNFILDFSPDSMLAVIAMQGDTMGVVTVLDLNSGVLKSIIDTGMEVYGLRVTGNSVFVLGVNWTCMVGAWYLPVGDGTPGARAGLEDCSWTVALSNLQPREHIYSGSISPDSCHIALITQIKDDHWLQVYDTSTGGNLANTKTEGSTVRFSLDGSSIWCATSWLKVEEWKVGEWERWSKNVGVDTASSKGPQEGCPWGSSHGYQVGDGWWILGPDGKRLLMLPPPWRDRPWGWVWKGQFLVLPYYLLEPVILELL